MGPSQNVRHCTQKWPGEKSVSVRSVPLSSKSDPKLPDCRETETETQEREAGRQRQRENSILCLFVVFIFYKDCSLGSVKPQELALAELYFLNNRKGREGTLREGRQGTLREGRQGTLREGR